ncbi:MULTISPECIES: Type 1 glutamine amidotransferase-like domain-containing protein [Mesobacillus]|uniref:Peptidase n=2 Tax=Mesobacillus TaxID=2675231 RepID=A0A0D6Z826_9BACI|nr:MULTISPECIES: Type 1 glutamine amidotransferase-like domain-containing protein [Mesobacillus]KIY21929.1 peptidase [Mesobacillus subterraneus]MDQ0415328.1 peptidase E [Mesobacillus stamsii]
MRQIIAMGGGGFSMEPDNPLLDLYILGQSEKRKPKVCFVPTASGDADNYVERFYSAFRSHECTPSHLSLFRPPTRDLEAYVMDKDIIYVGGGSTKNLLALWKEWGLDGILRKAWQRGTILAGVSAGSICWFEEGVTDSFGDGMERLQCLGFLKGSNCPHYDGEAEWRPAYEQFVGSGKIAGGFAADGGAALHFIDEELVRAVSSRPDAKAYEITLENGKVTEKVMKTTYLG